MYVKYLDAVCCPWFPGISSVATKVVTMEERHKTTRKENILDEEGRERNEKLLHC